MKVNKVMLKKHLAKLARIEYIFLLIAFPAILFFAFATPPAWGLDEQVHIARAYQISEGNIYPDKLPGKGNFGGELPKNVVEVLNYGHSESNSVNRAAPFFVRTDIENPTYLQSLLSKKVGEKRVVYDFGPTGPYAPVVYLPASAGMFIGRAMDLSVGSSILLAKFTQGMSYVLLAFLALRVVSKQKLKWTLFVLALLPATIFQAATINADAVTIGASFLFFAVVVNLFLEKKLTRSKTILLVTSSILLATSKPSYALFLVILPFLPNSIFATKKMLYLFKIGLPLLLLILLAFTSLKGLQYSDTILKYRDAATAAKISLGEQVAWTLTHPLDFLRILFETIILNTYEWQLSFLGLLGYNTIAVPYPLQVILLGGLLLSILYMEKLPTRLWVLFSTVGLASLLSIIFLLYGTFNEVGARPIIGVQGRYFIPCVPLLAVGLASILPIALKVSARAMNITIPIISGVCLFLTVWVYLTALY